MVDGCACLRTSGTRSRLDRLRAQLAEQFVLGDAFRGLRARHGLPGPERLEGLSVHRAFVDGVERADD